MEATTTRRRRTATPFTRAWNQAKKLDDGEKLQLVTMLINSVKPITTTTLDEEFDDMDKELYTPEEAYEMTMKDIKAIYDDATV
jgi:archaellum component FlaC